jgi:hypothetical protein
MTGEFRLVAASDCILLLLLCFYDLWKFRGGKVNHTAEFPSGIAAVAADVPPLSWHVAAVACAARRAADAA